LEERTVIFYDDELTAVMVYEEQVFVPVRLLCDYLGMDWSAQRKRIVGDAVLSEAARSVAVTVTEANGWGFSIAIDVFLYKERVQTCV
jgi:hypothetical protein